MSNDDILIALRPFLSERIRQHVSPLADDTQVRISIDAENGAAFNVTLKELRALWAMHDAYKALQERAVKVSPCVNFDPLQTTPHIIILPWHPKGNTP